MSATPSATQPIHCFAPVEAADARVLVLGTMPGQASLQQAAYYAHPRNAFWPIMLKCLAEEPLNLSAHRQWDHTRRAELLVSNRIAVWDVLAECIRPGSLDSAIAPGSVKANDLASFVASHTDLQRMIFNGQSAAKLYRRHTATSVDAVLEAQGRTLEQFTLPSTSPAMAMKTLVQKHELWHTAIAAP